MTDVINFQPLNDCIVVDATDFVPEEDTTEGGLIIKQYAHNRIADNRARVVKVGSRVTEVKPGDVIIYDYGKGTLIAMDPALKEEGRRQFMMTEKRILAVVEED